ncbi:hypothetical protein F5X96DRAFT_630946 [Biscogniauxia mediterranea]|nr:hypothetical protein F5X96DRAFT_630946 [Biscogniauxia mediterranea]
MGRSKSHLALGKVTANRLGRLCRSLSFFYHFPISMHAFQIHHRHHHCHRWRHYVVIIPGFVDCPLFLFFSPFDVLVLQCSDFPLVVLPASAFAVLITLPMRSLSHVCR